MSKKEFPKLSAAARVEYARKVKTLRQEAGYTQQELAKAAGISRQTLIALERGDTAPQTEVLLKVLYVFGVEIDGSSFTSETQLWLSILGALIEAIPEDRRGDTVNKAILLLSEGIRPREGDKSHGSAAPVSHNVGGHLDNDLEVIDINNYDLAAHRGDEDPLPDLP